MLTLLRSIAIPVKEQSMLVRFLVAVPVFALALPAAEVRAQEENPLVKFIKSKLRDEKKPFAMTVEIKVKAGKEREFEAAFVPFLSETRQEPGCVGIHLNRDVDHPDIYLVYEQFKSVAALEEHVKQKYAATLVKTIRPLQDGDAKTKVFVVP
jgi:autoinducer 2-degrading protein